MLIIIVFVNPGLINKQTFKLKREGTAGLGKLVAPPILLVAPPILMELPYIGHQMLNFILI